MNITLPELVTWLIVGGLAGSLVGMVVKRKKEGFGHWINLGIGLVGAVIGGVLFNLFNVDLGLGEFKVTLEDLISALAGSLLLLVIIWLVTKYRGSKAGGEN